MKLENQVSYRELSERLRDLGVPQDSLWWWGNFGWNDWQIVPHKVICDCTKSKKDRQVVGECSAFTCAELGEALQKAGIKEFPFIEYYSHTDCDMWKFRNPFTEYAEDKIVLDSVKKMNETNAKAEMWIYLIKNKLIDVKK